MNKKIVIYGGVGVAAIAALWWAHSRAVAADSSASGGAQPTILFTPTPALDAAGVDNWGSDAGAVSAGGVDLNGGTASGSLSLSDALLQQALAKEQTTRDVGEAAQLANLSSSIISGYQSANAPWTYTAGFTHDANGNLVLNASSDRTTLQNNQPIEQWVSGAGGVQTWTSAGGAVGVRAPGVAGYNVATKTGATYTGDQIAQWGASLEAQGNTGDQQIYDRLKAEGVSLASYDAMRGLAPGTAENWAKTNNLAVL